ncbi:hypothetical protein B0H13DRAFT_2661599 [Mycena leptocephala]|nr:hypothetical protein B0H13DRAFT_2661599 [Mycena leptocephala]
MASTTAATTTRESPRPSSIQKMSKLSFSPPPSKRKAPRTDGDGVLCQRRRCALSRSSVSFSFSYQTLHPPPRADFPCAASFSYSFVYSHSLALANANARTHLALACIQLLRHAHSHSPAHSSEHAQPPIARRPLCAQTHQLIPRTRCVPARARATALSLPPRTMRLRDLELDVPLLSLGGAGGAVDVPDLALPTSAPSRPAPPRIPPGRSGECRGLANGCKLQADHPQTQTTPLPALSPPNRTALARTAYLPLVAPNGVQVLVNTNRPEHERKQRQTHARRVPKTLSVPAVPETQEARHGEGQGDADARPAYTASEGGSGTFAYLESLIDRRPRGAQPFSLPNLTKTPPMRKTSPTPQKQKEKEPTSSSPPAHTLAERYLTSFGFHPLASYSFSSSGDLQASERRRAREWREMKNPEKEGTPRWDGLHPPLRRPAPREGGVCCVGDGVGRFSSSSPVASPAGSLVGVRWRHLFPHPSSPIVPSFGEAISAAAMEASTFASAGHAYASPAVKTFGEAMEGSRKLRCLVLGLRRMWGCGGGESAVLPVLLYLPCDYGPRGLARARAFNTRLPVAAFGDPPGVFVVRADFRLIDIFLLCRFRLRLRVRSYHLRACKPSPPNSPLHPHIYKLRKTTHTPPHDRTLRSDRRRLTARAQGGDAGVGGDIGGNSPAPTSSTSSSTATPPTLRCTYAHRMQPPAGTPPSRASSPPPACTSLPHTHLPCRQHTNNEKERAGQGRAEVGAGGIGFGYRFGRGRLSRATSTSTTVQGGSLGRAASGALTYEQEQEPKQERERERTAVPRSASTPPAAGMFSARTAGNIHKACGAAQARAMKRGKPRSNLEGVKDAVAGQREQNGGTKTEQRPQILRSVGKYLRVYSCEDGAEGDDERSGSQDGTRAREGPPSRARWPIPSRARCQSTMCAPNRRTRRRLGAREVHI